MSDPKSSLGEPIEEPTPADQSVLSVEETLAEAEAAGRNAVSDPSDLDPSIYGTVEDEPDEVIVERDVVDVERDAAYPVAGEERVVEERIVEERFEERPSEERTVAAEPIANSYADADTVVVAPSERAVAAPVVAPASGAAQPIFVQAPEAPRPKGNRGAAGAIGVLAALSFGVLYLAAWLGFGAITGDVTLDNLATKALQALGTWELWVPVVVFFLAFWLLGAVINRGRWGAWVVFGLLVGVASYGGHILGQLFQAPFWLLTASEGAKLVESALLAPLAIAAFVIGRELTIWFGAWVAARGKRVTELNDEAQREYERTLEAGPQLVHV